MQELGGAEMREKTVGELVAISYRGDAEGLSLEVQHRRFYRAEVFDLTHECRVAVGNPIWLDKTE